MKKGLKTIEAVNAYATLKDAKLSKMEDEEKFTVILAMRKLKGVVTAYEDFSKDAQEKLKPDNFDDLQDRAQRFDTLDNEEKVKTNKELAAYNRSVSNCVRPEQEKVNELEYDPLSKEAFSRLVKSNDFTVETMLTLNDILCDNQ